MGMTIDKTIEFFNGLECYTPQAKDARDVAIETMRKYQIMQADYNARLKADLVAILVDLQLEIEEQKFDVHTDKDVWNDAIRVCSDIIQQKINELKAESEDKDADNV